MVDFNAIDARHDAALMVGRKLNTAPLEANDLVKLFACCSDVPELSAYVVELENKIKRFEAASLDDRLLFDGTHEYWSTHCRHGGDGHDKCKATEFPGGGERNPSQCKTCEALCRCKCHEKSR